MVADQQLRAAASYSLRSPGSVDTGSCPGPAREPAMSGAAAAIAAPDAAAGCCIGGVYSNYLAQVQLAEDQHPVADLGPDGQHQASGEAVRPRTSRRNLHHRDA